VVKIVNMVLLKGGIRYMYKVRNTKPERNRANGINMLTRECE